MLDLMGSILKNWPSYTILLVGIVAVVASFFKDKQDSSQSDLIQKLGENNESLNKEIKKLSELNISLTSQFGEVTSQTNLLSKENLILTEKSQNLVKEVQFLTEQSKKMIEKVDEAISYNAEEHMQTGEVNLQFDNLKKNDIIYFKCGKMKFSANQETIRGVYEGRRDQFNELPFTLDFENDKLVLNMRIYDFENKLIVEIKNNKWRLNSNYSSAFNYDKKGFEVLDNRGNVALNFQIIKNRTIEVHGVFITNKVYNLSSTIFITLIGSNNEDVRYQYSESGFKGYIYKMDSSWQKVSDNSSLQQFHNLVQDEINSLNIKRIFEYTGNNWLHKRSYL